MQLLETMLAVAGKALDRGMLPAPGGTPRTAPQP